MNEPDVTDYESFLLAYESMSDEERKAYWKRENARENISYLNSLHHNISLNNQIIKRTQHWLKDMVDDYTGHVGEPSPEYTQQVKESIALGAELIEGCEIDTGNTRAEIAHVTRYPLYSEKRRQWYKTKEGQQWLQKNQPKKN